ncbi:MAG: hypothetical protein CSA23_05355 [Deltaproteobacteria bacterium]|nr:MAG: hypothetical protein CSA23_05355 [Deltaproteobacteria bacterium]
MSSILEALKKAQQESTTGDERPIPWLPPVGAGFARRRSYRRWWIMTAVLIVLGGIAGATFRMANQSESPPSSDAPPVMVKTMHKTVPQPSPQPAIPVKDHMKTDDPPVPSIPSEQPLPPPVANSKADSDGKQTVVQPRGMVRSEIRQSDALDSFSDDSDTVDPDPPVKKQAPMAIREDRQVRSDPRIDLQALVWSPEAVDRFVVINDKLVKEGGNVDTFVVVEILQDEVLIGEGAKRWYESFSIR